MSDQTSNQTGNRKIVPSILALILWLVTFVLGLEGIYTSKGIYTAIMFGLGQNIADVENSATFVVFLVAVGFMIFTIATAEYHRVRIGKPESWRLFAWTIAVELGIQVLYYFL
jgi:hypothetical protein